MIKQDDKDQNLSTVPNASYQKMFDKFKEIDTLPMDQWNKNHLLGYFVRCYKDKYGIDYGFRFNTPQPSKSFEIFHIGSIGSKLSTDPIIFKQYIDWVFTNEVPKLKRRFTSISFLNNEERLNFFKWKVLTSPKEASSYDRSTTLPSPYLEAMIGTGIKTFGDLAFANSAIKIGSLKNEAVISAFSKLQEIGFDFSSLDKVV